MNTLTIDWSKHPEIEALYRRSQESCWGDVEEVTPSTTTAPQATLWAALEAFCKEMPEITDYGWDSTDGFFVETESGKFAWPELEEDATATTNNER